MSVVVDLLAIGDPVKLSKIGRDTYHDDVDDPHDSSGYITELKNGVLFAIRVSWPDDEYNWYYAPELELIL